MPAPTLKLNCFVLGDRDGSGGIFPVNIKSTETVGDLKIAISAQMNHEVQAKRLRLWRTSLVVDAKFDENVGKINLVDGDMLSPIDPLSEVFPSGAVVKLVHIIVQHPSGPG